jgi:hypothetical protein
MDGPNVTWVSLSIQASTQGEIFPLAEGSRRHIGVRVKIRPTVPEYFEQLPCPYLLARRPGIWKKTSIPERKERELKNLVAVAALFALSLTQIDPALSAPVDPWKALAFLEGTWEAHAQAGSAGAQSSGTYAFKPELKHHVLVRRSDSAACKGPQKFDCEHSDMLYVYQDDVDQSLKAIYFDNEGQVIHYAVSTPDSGTAMFISDESQFGPQFRLVYELKGSVMWGKFQMRMPGQAAWKSYLEWSGEKK